MKEKSTLLLVEVGNENGSVYTYEDEIKDVLQVISCIRGVGEVSRVGVDVSVEIERRLSVAGLIDLLPADESCSGGDWCYHTGTPRQFILSLQSLSLLGLLNSELNLSDPMSEDNRSAVSELFCRCRDWFSAAKAIKTSGAKKDNIT